ncbi:hypothetical protein BJ878DRAFT_3976 [Calycina marina]|uniref:Zf-CHY-domain-containing protein n=1 Tax=Calycina marina TaxID=1763456 RepID=A0A9P7ZAG9_9HELO|nr:hypothetical protein BJ878DRAFT_3976 [Calycina marina]
MSYVSEFLINPVLRQARRFSRSQPGGERVEEQTNLDRSNEITVEDIVERLGSLNQPIDGTQDPANSISGDVLTSSPMEETGSLQEELEALDRLPSTAPAVAALHASSMRADSPRSNTGYVDDVSENPMFGTPSRFRTESGTSYTEHNVTDARMSPVEGLSRSNTQVLSHIPDSLRRHGDRSLPADDGMGALRQQIVSIQAMEAPAEQKAQMMHQLLTRGYTQSQQLYYSKNQPQRSASPVNMVSQERPTTPGSLSSYIWQMNGTESAPPTVQHTFHLSPGDLEPTYAPPDSPEAEEDGTIRMKEDEGPVLGCRHYKRNVKLQCSTCDRWYTCRLCHDEAESHVLIRQATNNMLCMLCGSAQRAAEDCIMCGERTAWYYCGLCKLWDNDPNKSIYHCNDCGICRKGRGLGKDFFHCKTCGVCMSMSNEHSHKCIERVSDCDCPICGEYMFDSPRPVVFMLCGHGIHQACYYEHMKSSYKCPICSKSTVNMETQFRNLDRAIDSQPMPPQFRDTKAMVSCNDCYAKSAVKYHWLGLKCAICDSYNTAQLSILSDPVVEVPTIDAGEAENLVPSNQPTGEGVAPMPIRLGPIRTRRHSSHLYIPQPSSEDHIDFSPYQLSPRMSRSVSPVRGPGLFDALAAGGIETDDSADEDDDLDFWGRDEMRSMTSAEVVEGDLDVDIEDEDSDDASLADEDCDEGDEEEDAFELLGHR